MRTHADEGMLENPDSADGFVCPFYSVPSIVVKFRVRKNDLMILRGRGLFWFRRSPKTEPCRDIRP